MSLLVLCFLVCVQPTLLAFERAAPAFVGMALKSLDNTIAEWKALEAR